MEQLKSLDENDAQNEVIMVAFIKWVDETEGPLFSFLATNMWDASGIILVPHVV